MVSAAVHAAGTALRDQLVALAVADSASPLHGADPADVEVRRRAHVAARAARTSARRYVELMQRNRAGGRRGDRAAGRRRRSTRRTGC